MYDPVTFSGGEMYDVAQADFDKEKNKMHYKLEHAGRVLIRMGVCPQCSGRIRIISFIEDPAIVQRILTHLGLWHVPARKRAPPPATPEIPWDYSVADDPASYD